MISGGFGWFWLVSHFISHTGHKTFIKQKKFKCLPSNVILFSQGLKECWCNYNLFTWRRASKGFETLSLQKVLFQRP